ncbi:MAG: two-component sensor histidine kinase, partial [Planctomycetota bacterium]
MFRLVQGLFSSMSLERKCLLFFGSAFTILMCGAFLVVQTLGNRLVQRTTQQRARDLADWNFYQLHHQAQWLNSAPDELVEFNASVLEDLRAELLPGKIEFDILGLKDAASYVDLPLVVPEDPSEQARLEALEPQFRQQLALRIEEQQPDVAKSIDLGENESMSMIGLGSLPLHQQVGPIDGKYIYYRPIFPKYS